MAPVRPRKQAAGLQRLKLQIAAASPDPPTRAFPRCGAFPGKLGHPTDIYIYIYIYRERERIITIHNVYTYIYIYIYIYMYIHRDMYIYIYIYIHM